MKKYECLFLLNPSLTDEKIAEELTFFEELVSQQGGSVSAKTTQKKINLGYEINKNENAYNVVVDFSVMPDKMAEIERVLRLRGTTNILRYTLCVKVEKKVTL